MDIFNEQIVKRAKKPKDIMIKILSVLLLFAIPALCCVLAYVITPYMIYVGLFIFLGGIYAVWYIFTTRKVEYEYSVVGEELHIAKVIALRKRKKVVSLPIKDIEKMDKGDKSVDGIRFTKTFFAAGDIDKDDENYYAVFNDTAYGRCLLIFAPNEKMLNAMKRHFRKEIMLKLFYHRDV